MTVGHEALGSMMARTQTSAGGLMLVKKTGWLLVGGALAFPATSGGGLPSSAASQTSSASSSSASEITSGTRTRMQFA